MSRSPNELQATQPASVQTFSYPRPVCPSTSITSEHCPEARDATLQASAGSTLPGHIDRTLTSLGQHNSSLESHDTDESDPEQWFDQSNKNPTATFDSHATDADLPFFQGETDFSNEDYLYSERFCVPVKLTAAQMCSSEDDDRSIVDDLTIEIQKLKGKLQRYKQREPSLLQTDELFEVKAHGLSRGEKCELEATLRGFAAGLGDLSDVSFSRFRKASLGPPSRTQVSGPSSMVNHTASSSSFTLQPGDEVYAPTSSHTHAFRASTDESATNPWAQLRTINITPEYFRNARLGNTTKLQFRSEGGQTQWRRGAELNNLHGRYSSDSDENSTATDTVNSDGGERRNQRGTNDSTDVKAQSRILSKTRLNLELRTSSSSEEFCFQRNFSGEPALVDTLFSSSGLIDGCNFDDSHRGHSGSEAFNKRKCSHNGAAIYYREAPFYTDLSCDPGDISSATKTSFTGECQHEIPGHSTPSPTQRPDLRALLGSRPLSDGKITFPEVLHTISKDDDRPGLTAASQDGLSEFELNLEME